MKTPIKLPVKLGNKDGFNACLLTDATDTPLASLYGIPLHTSVEEVRQLEDPHKRWTAGLEVADWLVGRINAEEKPVSVKDALKDSRERHDLQNNTLTTKPNLPALTLAVETLAEHERGRNVLKQLRKLLPFCYSLDTVNQAALLTVLAGAIGDYPDTAKTLICGNLQLHAKRK